MVIRPRGPELRAAEAATLLDLTVRTPEARAAGVVLDLSAVSKVDSAVLGAIAQINDQRPLRLVGLAPLVESVLAILGILPLLAVDPSVGEAVGRLHPTISLPKPTNERPC